MATSRKSAGDDPEGNWRLSYGGYKETFKGRLSKALLVAARLALSYREVRVDEYPVALAGYHGPALSFIVRA